MSKKSTREVSISRVYADALKGLPKEKYDYESTSIQWGTQDPYKIVKRIGRGKVC